MIDTSTWKEFLLSDVFEIKKGKRLTKENQTLGDTVFVGATALNNGITARIGQEPIHEGNTISLTYNGSVGEAFYQKEPFWASDDVNVLYPKNFVMNEKIAMFFCVILRHEKQMWSYARKWNLEQMNRTVIKLPADKAGKIDLSYIENYIGEIDNDIEKIPDYFLNEGYEKAVWYLDNINQEEFESKYASPNKKIYVSLNDREWKKFRLSEIVDDIHNGKAYNASDLIKAADGDDYVAYITRTDENNGIAMFVAENDYEGIENAGAITIGDTTATIFYQDRKFITGPHIIVVRAEWLNVYTANFLITILSREKYRYPVFGRAFTKDLISETEIKLPIDSKGYPDYIFMQNYIKSRYFSSNIWEKGK